MAHADSVDTTTLPTSSRIAAWEAAAAQAFAPLRAVVVSGPDDFPALFQTGEFGRLGSTVVTLESTHLEWTSHSTSSEPCDKVAIVVGAGGQSRLKRTNQQVSLHLGDVLLIDSPALDATVHEDHTRIITFLVPRALLEERMGSVTPLDGFRLPGTVPATRILATYLENMAGLASSDHPRTDDASSPSALSNDSGVEKSPGAEDEVIRMAIDLLVFALNDVLAENPLADIPPSTTTLLRIEQALSHHLRNPDAGAEEIASDAGVSVRYANQLLAQRGTSLIRELNLRRLLRAAHDLVQPVNAGRPVADVARSWGFRHMSRFSSRFREQLGVSPHEYRQRFTPTREVR